MSASTLPTFFILGAAKAGTTTLYDLLKQHPEIYLSYVKEPMFFSHDENYQRGVEWYIKTFFLKAEEYTARGEATPHYLYWAEKVAPRIKAVYGEQEVKFVVIFRDPVQRAYSWYWNMVKEGKEDLPFPQAFAAEEERIRANWEHLYYAGAMTYGYYRGGCYATQVEEFLKYFPRQRFYFLLQEDLRSLEDEAFGGLLCFLGVDSRITFTPVMANPASLPRNRALHRWLHGPSATKEWIKKAIPLRWRYHFKAWLTEKNLRKISYPALDKEVGIRLRERYRDEINRLEDLIGRDLSHWK